MSDKISHSNLIQAYMSDKINNMKHLIKKHQTCIEILEAITFYQSMIDIKEESIKNYAHNFPDLEKKYRHKIEIYNMCIERFKKRYNLILKQ